MLYSLCHWTEFQAVENLREIKLRKIFLETLFRRNAFCFCVLRILKPTKKQDNGSRSVWSIKSLHLRMHGEKDFVCVHLPCSFQIWFLKKKRKNINFQINQLCLSEKLCISFRSRCLKMKWYCKNLYTLTSLKTQALLAGQLLNILIAKI